MGTNRYPQNQLSVHRTARVCTSEATDAQTAGNCDLSWYAEGLAARP
jgi:hypothetical protein